MLGAPLDPQHDPHSTFFFALHQLHQQPSTKVVGVKPAKLRETTRFYQPGKALGAEIDTDGGPGVSL